MVSQMKIFVSTTSEDNQSNLFNQPKSFDLGFLFYSNGNFKQTTTTSTSNEYCW